MIRVPNRRIRDGDCFRFGNIWIVMRVEERSGTLMRLGGSTVTLLDMSMKRLVAIVLLCTSALDLGRVALS
jgi:hypothetical protein